MFSFFSDKNVQIEKKYKDISLFLSPLLSLLSLLFCSLSLSFICMTRHCFVLNSRDWRRIISLQVETNANCFQVKKKDWDLVRRNEIWIEIVYLSNSTLCTVGEKVVKKIAGVCKLAWMIQNLKFVLL